MDATADMAAQVRGADPDRHLSVLYALPDRRADLLALYAFDAEIATIRERVSEPMPGEIRLQWWRDAIAGGQPTGNPQADALIAAIGRHGLPPAAFDNLLEARIFDLYDDPFPDRNALEGYCGETESAVIQLASLILDPASATRFADMAGHAGCARAILRMLRLMPRHVRRGQCFVPLDMLAAAGTSREEFLSPEGGPARRRAAELMVALAREHLSAFESRAGELPQSLRPAYLPLATVGATLRKMHGAADGAGTIFSPLRRQWLLLKRAMGGW